MAVDHGLVAGLEPALLDHGLAGHVAALEQLDADIAEALALVFGEQRVDRGVAVGDGDALVLGLLDQRRPGVGTRMAHDLDAVGARRHGLAELVEHGLAGPGRELLLEVDAERLGRGLGPVLARQGGAVAGLAAHLEVHHQALAQLLLRLRAAGAQQRRRAGRGQQRPHAHDSLPDCDPAAIAGSGVRSLASASLPPSAQADQAVEHARPLHGQMEDHRGQEHQPDHEPGPEAAEPAGDDAGLHAADDVAAEQRADDAALAAARSRCRR